MAKKSHTAVSFTAPKGSKKKTLARISVERAHNGGFIATHSYTGDPYTEPEKHAFSDKKGLDQHMESVLGGDE